MSLSKTQKILIGLGALVILGGVLYYFYYGSSSVPVDLLLPQESQAVGQDVIVLVEKLNLISIDSSLFSSVLFTSLKDFTVALFPESQGKLNLFAPIGQ